MSAEAFAHNAIITAQPLSKLVPVISAPPHFPEVAGQKEEKPDRKEQVVNEANHDSMAGCSSEPDRPLRIAERNRTSVAP